MTAASKTKLRVQVGITIVLGVFSIYLVITEPNNRVMWSKIVGGKVK